MGMRFTNIIGRLATLGLVAMLFALASFATLTTETTLHLSGNVEEAVTVIDLYQRAQYELQLAETLRNTYVFKPGPGVRSQFQMATALLAEDLKAASSKEVGDPESDQELVAQVLSEQQRYLLAAAQLFAAVDAGDEAQVHALDQTMLDPLVEQMKQQVGDLVDAHSQEASQRLTELEQTQQRNQVITPIVFTLGLALLGLCWWVLQIYRRRFDEARRGELTQLEEAARLKAEQLGEQQKLMQMRDQLIMNVSHELRTPLTAVIGYVELLVEHPGKVDAAMQKRWIQKIKKGCDDLETLTNNILAAAEVDRGRQNLRLEATPVAPVVREVLASFDPQDVQTFAIRQELPEHLAVWADQLALRQVLRNLLSNAFKYASKGTPVSICAVVDEHPQVCICVQDAGPGIPPSELPLLFQQFVRLKRDLSGTVRGTGLGLYISKQLIEAMDGQIWAESSGVAGEGSCFCFTLPRADAPAP